MMLLPQLRTPYTSCSKYFSENRSKYFSENRYYAYQSCMEVDEYSVSLFSKEEDVLRFYAYHSSFTLIILQLFVAVFVSWGLTTSCSFWCCWCCNRKSIDSKKTFITPRLSCSSNSSSAEFVGFILFYLGRCTSKSFWGPMLWFSWPMRMTSLFNWYLIQDDPFSILLPLITQDIFNIMIKIYQGRQSSSTISIAESSIELFGFVKSCVMILLAIAKALVSMIDVVTEKQTLCAVVTGSALLLIIADPTGSELLDDFLDFDDNACECEECGEDCGDLGECCGDVGECCGDVGGGCGECCGDVDVQGVCDGCGECLECCGKCCEVSCSICGEGD